MKKTKRKAHIYMFMYQLSLITAVEPRPRRLDVIARRSSTHLDAPRRIYSTPRCNTRPPRRQFVCVRPWIRVRITSSGVTRAIAYWELWLAFVREMYLKLVITPLKVDTGDERADIFTKAMPKGNGDYYRFRDDLVNVSSRVP